MDRKPEDRDARTTTLASHTDRVDGTTTRRAFLRGTARKAVYATPVVLTMTASTARAGSEFDSTCGENGSPYAVNEDCCAGLACNAMGERDPG